MKIVLLTLLPLLVFWHDSTVAQSDKVAVKFVNQHREPLKIYAITANNKPTLKTDVEPGNTYGLLSSLGRRFRVEIGNDEKLYFELTEIGQQTILLNETHSVFPLLGWKIHLSNELWRTSPQLTQVWFDLMVGQLNRIVEAVPKPSLQQLRQVPIWVNPPYKNSQPTAEYHVSEDWLRENSRDPKMVRAIEITTVQNFAFENVRMPYLVLHELSHAYHDRVLNFRHPGIRTRFEEAKKQGDYDRVDRFTGRRIVRDKAYAMSNEKEYFAENSEAFFGQNDFYPFHRSQLLEHDKAMHDLLAELWGVEENSQ